MDTRMRIIEAAGELFAERGYAGASIRAIVKKANVFLSAVNYHFGSKEELLLETLKHITTHRVMGGLMPILQDEKAMKNEDDFKKFLYQVVHGFLNTFLLSEEPAWCGRFFIRMSFELNPELRQKVFSEAGHREQFVRLAKQVHPSHSDERVRLNAQACIGMLHHFVLTWNETRVFFGKGPDSERIEHAARFLYHRMLAIGEVDDENQNEKEMSNGSVKTFMKNKACD